MWLWLLAGLAGLYLLRRWHRERQTVPRLSDKFVLITGCDSGFGNLLARQLDARGLPVLAACLSEAGAARLRADASSRLQTPEQSRGERISPTHPFPSSPGLWGLVNNAGVAVPTGPNEWLTKEDFAKVLDVNLLGLIEVTLSLLPLLRQARGRVVNVASVMGRVSMFGGGYCISKYGVEAFSDSLRVEMRHFGVKVSIIEPGYFSTAVTNFDAHNKHLLSCWERLPQETKAAYGDSYLEDTFVSMRSMLKTCSLKLSLVTDCMEHALTSCHPRARYSAGWDAKLIYIPLSYLPSAFTDLIFSWVYPKPALKV
ncbi:RDH16 dehydrogenase, partial [Tricholaema leucomelas]|nr:RDH16 dehydrogenase [Tricholaema leucomelas]